jgi:hypothetical protein
MDPLWSCDGMGIEAGGGEDEEGGMRVLVGWAEMLVLVGWAEVGGPVLSSSLGRRASAMGRWL